MHKKFHKCATVVAALAIVTCHALKGLSVPHVGTPCRTRIVLKLGHIQVALKLFKTAKRIYHF